MLMWFVLRRGNHVVAFSFRHLLGVALHAGNFLNGGTRPDAERLSPTCLYLCQNRLVLHAVAQMTG